MYTLALLSALACRTEAVPETPLYLDTQALDALSMTRVKAHVDVLADDATGGRIPGSPGHAAARDYIEGELMAIGLEPFGDAGGYLHRYETEGSESGYQLLDDGSIAPVDYHEGVNLVGLLPGTDPAQSDEYIVVMAHYDHLGVTEDGAIYNGAFDDVTGVAVLLELARVMVEQQIDTDRSIIFLVTDAEEFGLEGAENWLADKVVPYGDIAFGVSLDPVGRGVLPDYWPLVLMGLERSPALLDAWRDFSRYAEMDVIFVHRDIIPIFASDQDEFYRVDEPIPAIWYTSPGMAFYHTTEDTPETIDYRSVRDQTRFMLQALAFFGDDDADYPYQGAPAIGPEHAADVIPMIEGILASDYPDTSEREEAQGYLDELTAVVEADDINVLSMDQEVFFYASIYFLVFVLPAEHIGEIPPPFPED